MRINPEFEDFQVLFPNLFREYPRCGFSLENGWKEIVISLCHVLEYAITRLPEEERVQIYCAQVKEKFGSLRFYMTAESPYMSGAIRVAEGLSSKTCRVCGCPGKRRDDGYIEVLCDAHHSEGKKIRVISDYII
jgi:hypothetical protein